MTTDHFTQLFPAACAGFGLMLAGGANWLLRAWQLHVRVFATAVCVAFAVVAAESLQPGTVSGTSRLLALGLVPFFLLAFRQPVAWASTLVALLHRPAVRCALLAVGGGGLALGSIVKFDHADEAALGAAMAELEWLERVPMVASQQVTATTDRGSCIVLKEPIAVRDGVDWDGAEERTLHDARLGGQVIRRGGATEQSNCAGWVFTGGQFNLSPDAVEVILKENGYQAVREPLPGDLVIYRLGGAIAHVAVVRYVTEGQPVMVEGKWGPLGVFLHPADSSTYGTDYTFYRSDRQGHLLAGIGGPDSTSQTQSDATE